MQSRREFLKNLGATLGIAAAATTAAPYVFDYGANLYKRNNALIRAVQIDGQEYYVMLVNPSVVYELQNDVLVDSNGVRLEW